LAALAKVVGFLAYSSDLSVHIIVSFLAVNIFDCYQISRTLILVMGPCVDVIVAFVLQINPITVIIRFGYCQ